MEYHLLAHSQQHFRHAHGTLYTLPPLSDLLGINGPFGDSIFKGEALPDNIPLDPAAHLLTMHQSSLLQPGETNHHPPLVSEELMKGFRKWPEHMTTSPSGHHLGMYKSLLKDYPPKDPPATGPSPSTYSIEVMQCIFDLLQLALWHVHVYKQWKTIWIMYLETKPGYLHLDYLRTLHLCEADYNLLLK